MSLIVGTSKIFASALSYVVTITGKYYVKERFMNFNLV